jgi:hypothetical protein
MIDSCYFLRYKHSIRFILISFSFMFMNIFISRSQDLLKNKYVSLEAKNISMVQLISLIKKQAGINFCYKYDSMSNLRISTYKINKIRVDSLLNMFRPELNYKIINGQIVIYKQKKGVRSIEISLSNNKHAVQKKSKTDADLNADNFSNNKIEKRTIVLYDTIIKTIVDTMYTTLIDTIKVVIKDTIHEKIITQHIITQIQFKPQFELEFFLSPLFAITNNYSASSPEFNQQATSINNSQNNAWGFSSGVDINLNSNNWSIKSGLGYTQFNSDFNYTKTIENIAARDYMAKISKTREKRYYYRLVCNIARFYLGASS